MISLRSSLAIIGKRRSTSRIFIHEPIRNIGGGYSRMLDMGGAPSGSTADSSKLRAVDASKNSKIQAVAFEFELLTKSLDYAAKEAATHDAAALSQQQADQEKHNTKLEPVSADLDRVQEVASLMNVDMDTTPGEHTQQSKDTIQKASSVKGATAGAGMVGMTDIRAKYAVKLSGGVAGLELAKQQAKNSIKGGDASGHIAVRKRAIQETAASPTKWMALTGTGKLLTYLTHRSIRIALLPACKWKEDDAKQTEQQDMMEQFQRQLKDVVMDSFVSLKDQTSLEDVLDQQVMKKLGIHPNKILLVSEKDDYLRAAKDLGMLTCRLQLPNTRRGNVTAHYNTPTIPDVQEVVNEVNGISFNTVLNR